MSNSIAGNKAPFNLEVVGKLNVAIVKAAYDTKNNGLDEVFVSAGKDDYVMYGKNGNLKDLTIGQQINFTDENGKAVTGTIKKIDDEKTTFFEGAKGTITSIGGAIASIGAPIVTTGMAIASIPAARASAAAAAEKALQPGGITKFLNMWTKMPTHYPSEAELARAAKEASESVSAKNIIVTGAVIGAVIAVAIPVTGGILAASKEQDDSKLREFTGKPAKVKPQTVNNPDVSKISTGTINNNKSIFGDNLSIEDAANWLKNNPNAAKDAKLLNVADYKGDGVIDAEDLVKAANNKVVILNGVHSFFLPGEVKPEAPRVIEKTIIREKVIVKGGKSTGEKLDDLENTGKIVTGVAKGAGELFLKAMGGGR
jgi:hypothetical protein